MDYKTRNRLELDEPQPRIMQRHWRKALVGGFTLAAAAVYNLSNTVVETVRDHGGAFGFMYDTLLGETSMDIQPGTVGAFIGGVAIASYAARRGKPRVATRELRTIFPRHPGEYVPVPLMSDTTQVIPAVHEYQPAGPSRPTVYNISTADGNHVPVLAA